MTLACIRPPTGPCSFPNASHPPCTDTKPNCPPRRSIGKVRTSEPRGGAFCKSRIGYQPPGHEADRFHKKPRTIFKCDKYHYLSSFPPDKQRYSVRTLPISPCYCKPQCVFVGYHCSMSTPRGGRCSTDAKPGLGPSHKAHLSGALAEEWNEERLADARGWPCD